MHSFDLLLEALLKHEWASNIVVSKQAAVVHIRASPSEGCCGERGAQAGHQAGAQHIKCDALHLCCEHGGLSCGQSLGPGAGDKGSLISFALQWCIGMSISCMSGLRMSIERIL